MSCIEGFFIFNFVELILNLASWQLKKDYLKHQLEEKT